MRLFQLFNVLLLGSALALPASSSAAQPGRFAEPPSTIRAPRGIAPTPAIGVRWAVDDAEIMNGDASRTWTWGPEIFRSGIEPYDEAPAGARSVWYLDKARMEITRPEADPDNTWYVSTGLLVREMLAGELQLGDGRFEPRVAADLPLAGDLDALIETTISFGDLAPLASLHNDRRAPSRLEFDTVVVERLGPNGSVSQDERLLTYDVHLRSYDEVLGHNIPHVFTDALPADKLLYIAGRPLTEPYWTVVPVNRVPTDVLVQAFERRVLTYTPSNPSEWRVEWGNVGRQYAQWRFGSAEDGARFLPTAALEAKPVIRKLATLSPSAAAIAEGHKGLVSVAVLDMQTGDLYSINGTRAMPMFSTAKVPIMLAVLHRVQREKRPLAAWEDAAIRSMIQRSDNASATSLIVAAGGAKEVTRYLRAIGIHDTVMDGESWGYSTTTTQDMARLMSKLGHCTILNAELCHYALEIMRDVTPSQRWGVNAGVPDGVPVALKNGWFPESEGWTTNSIGYVKGKRKRYAIAVFAQSNPEQRHGIETIEAIAREIYGALP